MRFGEQHGADHGLLARQYLYGMRAIIDKAGRLVIPKPLRDRLGLVPGEVEIAAEGTALRIEPMASDELIEENEPLVIPASGGHVDDDVVRALRDADQR
jgi:AbrB family looped-hinge helix DNA binding protein